MPKVILEKEFTLFDASMVNQPIKPGESWRMLPRVKVGPTECELEDCQVLFEDQDGIVHTIDWWVIKGKKWSATKQFWKNTDGITLMKE